MTPGEPTISLARWRPWLFALLLCLPFWLIWLAPAVQVANGGAPESTVATGFPQYDQPYYLANGRAIFERGNGLAGPNPYDPDPAAPAIYFHLLTWLFGLAAVGLRLDPGLVYLLFGIAAGLVFARLTLALLEKLGAARPALPWLGALAMWGGGIASLLFFAASRLGLLKEGVEPTVFEPGGGWWLLPWGRNLVYTTEAFYHCLVLGIFLAFAARRFRLLAGLAALLAASHPFTGAQVLLALGLWLAVNLVKPEITGLPRLPAQVVAALAAIAAAFGAYYFLFLPSHPAHQEMTRSWALDWQEKPLETLAAYLPLAVVLFFAWRRKQLLRGPDAFFFALFAAVAFLLAHHGYFAPAHQPLHFSHGYFWLPLFLLALPLYERAAAWAAAGGWRRRALAALVVLLAAADNLTFIAATITGRPQRDVRFADPELFDAYRLLEEKNLHGVLVSNDPLAGYLAATYSPARPFFGHFFNTPQRDARLAELEAFFGQGRQGPNIAAADLLLIRGHLAPGQLQWSPLYEGERWTLYQRRR